MAKIMIIEDNALNMQLFSDVLSASGYEIVSTMEVLKAIDIAKDNMPDLIITDIQMPAMSGLELIKIIRADDKLKDIPVIAATAFAMKGDEDKIMQAGFNGYIAKPISIKPFLETVASFIQ